MGWVPRTMTITDYLAAYLGGGFLLLAWAAWINSDTGARAAFWCSLLWPLTLIATVVVSAASAVKRRYGWRIAVQWRRDLRCIGFRHPPCGKRGWAVRFCWLELQAWKERP